MKYLIDWQQINQPKPSVNLVSNKVKSYDSNSNIILSDDENSSPPVTWRDKTYNDEKSHIITNIKYGLITLQNEIPFYIFKIPTNAFDLWNVSIEERQYFMLHSTVDIVPPLKYAPK